MLRRVERLFTKISKRSFAKRQLDWTAVAGILNGLCLALGKDESLAKILYFKLLINSAISLVLNEASTSDASNTAVNTSHIFLAQLSASTSASFQCPLVYCKALIRLVGKYTSALKVYTPIMIIFLRIHVTSRPFPTKFLIYDFGHRNFLNNKVKRKHRK